jgi:hypothetical protein
MAKMTEKAKEKVGKKTETITFLLACGSLAEATRILRPTGMKVVSARKAADQEDEDGVARRCMTVVAELPNQGQ